MVMTIELLMVLNFVTTSMLKIWQNGTLTVNLGTQFSYSVLEAIAAFELASGKEITYEFTQRLPGDLAEYFANTNLLLSEYRTGKRNMT